MKKRILSLMLGSALILSAFAGCSSVPVESSSSEASGSSESSTAESEASEGESSEGEATGETVEIEFFQQKREAVASFDAVIAAFEEANPGISVLQNNVADGGTVLITRASSNEMPDVLTHWPVNAEVGQFAREGKLVDLTGSAVYDNIVPSYVESMVMEDGKSYGVPFSLNFFGVIYDTDKFAEAGYEVPKTWDEFMTIAADIQSKGEVAFMMPNKDSWTISQLLGGLTNNSLPEGLKPFYDELNAGTATWVGNELFVDGVNKMIELETYSQGDTLSMGYDQAVNDFATGTGYMFIQGVWATPSIRTANPDKNIGMFPIPNDSGEMSQAVGVDVAFYAGANGTEEKLAASETFLSFLASPEGAQIYADLDGSPSCVVGVTPNIVGAEPILELIDTNGVLDIAVPPTGWEEAKRAIIQDVFISKDATSFLTTLDTDWQYYLEADQAAAAE